MHQKKGRKSIVSDSFNTVMKHIFLAFTSISGCSSAGRLHRHQYLLENILNPFALGNRATPGFLGCFVVDIEWHSDA